MALHNNCISRAEDLITSREQTRSGFIEAGLEKNRKALPYIEDAKTLKSYALRAKTPLELLNMPNIYKGLLTASGLSDKSLKYFSDIDIVDVIR